MQDVLTFPSISPSGAHLWPLSVAAYHALGEAGLMPENTELLYGFVYKKMSKSPFHRALVRRLLTLLNRTLPSGFFISSEQPITCEGSEPEPDIAVIGGTEEEFWTQHPSTADLVIEVCVTSDDYDRSKLRAYSDAGIKECWFVLGPEKQIEVYRGPQNGQFMETALYGPGASVNSTPVIGLTLSLESLFTK
jgi:Uma2 family endonuclease